MRTVLQLDVTEACRLIGEALTANEPWNRFQVSPILEMRTVGHGMAESQEPSVRFEVDVTARDVPPP